MILQRFLSFISLSLFVMNKMLKNTIGDEVQNL